MRIDIEAEANRKWIAKCGLPILRKYIGMTPGPLLVLSCQPAFPNDQIMKYKAQGALPRCPFSSSECELFAAFVSKLNSCEF